MGNPTINEIPFCISGICRHPLILNKRRSPALATVFYRREEEHGRGRGTTTNAGEKRKTRSAGAAYPAFVLADQSGSTWFEKASSSYLITTPMYIKSQGTTSHVLKPSVILFAVRS